MQRLFSTLSEKDKRRYAGVEATKLGYGGIDYISKLFDLDPKTIRRVLQEIDLNDDVPLDRVRKKGGGRTLAIEQSSITGNGDTNKPSHRSKAAKNTRSRPTKGAQEKTLGAHPDRNAQFENIPKLKTEYLAAGDLVISIDTNKKELIGDFAREGHTHTQTLVETLDHAFPTASQCKLIPHGIYDLARKEGSIQLNTSHDTSELCCDSISLWWQR